MGVGTEDISGRSGQRAILDDPMPQPALRKAPRESALSAMRGSRPDTINTSSGEDDLAEDAANLGEDASSKAVQALQALAAIEENAKLLSTVLPGVMAICQDFITTMRVTVPQALVALTSGAPMGLPTGVPLPPPAAGPGGLPLGAAPMSAPPGMGMMPGMPPGGGGAGGMV